MKNRIMGVLLMIALIISIVTGCGIPSSDNSSIDRSYQAEIEGSSVSKTGQPLDPEGSYTTKEDVSSYLELYDRLPDNFITKKEARSMGWQGGSLEPYAPGFCIGGDKFGNYEGRLPKGEMYRECDIDTLGANSRGAKRLIYAVEDKDVVAIYYTGDHYKSFEEIYAEN